MKVLYVSHFGGLGGAERSLLELMIAMRSLGVEPLLAAPLGGLGQRASAMGIPHFSLSLGRLARPRSFIEATQLLFHIVRAAIQLAWIMRTHGVEVVHSNTTVAQLAAGPAAFVAGKRNVWHWRDFYPPSRHTKLLAHLSDVIVPISNAAFEHAASQVVSTSKLRLVMNSVRDLASPIDQGKVACWRRQASAQPADLLVVVLGQSAPRKGHDVLIEAMVLLRQCCPHLRALLVCDEIDEAARENTRRVRARATALGCDDRVVIVDGCRDPAPVLRAADIVVVPSLREPFGRVAVEAMLLERPVIASAVDGLLEIVDPGVSGLLVEPGDPAALAEAISSLSKQGQLRHQMGEAGRRIALARFAGNSSALRMREIYSSLFG